MDDFKATPGKLLAAINSPKDLKEIPINQLEQVCNELRDFIIETVAVHGGHFGASLGVVELTTALHYVFDTPKDQLVWDVGHQAYGHKILTGRKEAFHTNRKYKGVSGFPKRSESEYDTFGVGHSSTSISAALGMAAARDIKKSDEQIVAVIGDGSMTAGMAFEALNNAGSLKTDMIVILNDNNMSIDPNVGALNEYLVEITASQTFNKLRNEVYDALGHFKSAGDKMRKLASRLEKSLVTALTPGSLFKAFGFKYYGPVDGHNVEQLVKTLNDLKKIPGPKLLHAVTIKGKGFAPAERDPLKWHAQSSPFDKITGESLVKKPTEKKPPKYQDVFGDAIVELAKMDERVVGITAAMPSGTGLVKMMNEIPERSFDVGIAEQHAVTFAAGLATQGLKPFVAIYSSFLQRGFDQLVHDCAIQKLPVVFCMDRAGLVGADGPTHHGLYDIAYLRGIPHMILCAPMNEIELRNMMFTGLKQSVGSFAIRYPRGNAENFITGNGFEEMEIGKGRILNEGDSVVILSYGTIGLEAEKAVKNLESQGISVGHYDMRFAKPLDEKLVIHAMRTYNRIITIEDGTVLGGFGSAVAEFVASQEKPITVTIMGVPDRLVEHGEPHELFAEIGLNAAGIEQKVKLFVSLKVEQ
ncbi:1-deoxy-D-xylulose-5-phosphate synthase [bacterium]|nr:MAG: 1-deoxy-D-xylulose-5-phosphate synthase [bacterium]